MYAELDSNVEIIAHMRKLLWRSAVSVALLIVFYLGWIVASIHRQSEIDEARPADVILVLGAAEYRGKPSPVLRARLDHALALYKKNLAPRILTTGGAGGDPVFTEGEVGRDYLVRHGVPSEAIILEAESESTMHSTAAAAEIMRRMNLKSCIVVSDGYHIFRVKENARVSRPRRLRLTQTRRTERNVAGTLALSAPGDWLYALAARNHDLSRS